MSRLVMSKEEEECDYRRVSVWRHPLPMRS